MQLIGKHINDINFHFGDIFGKYARIVPLEKEKKRYQEICGTSYQKELQKTYQIKFRAEEVMEGKGDKLYIQ